MKYTVLYFKSPMSQLTILCIKVAKWDIFQAPMLKHWGMYVTLKGFHSYIKFMLNNCFYNNASSTAVLASCKVALSECKI